MHSAVVPSAVTQRPVSVQYCGAALCYTGALHCAVGSAQAHLRTVCDMVDRIESQAELAGLRDIALLFSVADRQDALQVLLLERSVVETVQSAHSHVCVST